VRSGLFSLMSSLSRSSGTIVSYNYLLFYSLRLLQLTLLLNHSCLAFRRGLISLPLLGHWAPLVGFCWGVRGIIFQICGGVPFLYGNYICLVPRLEILPP